MTQTPLAAEAIVGHDQTACQGRPNWMSGLGKPAHGGWSFSLTGDGAVVAVTAVVVPPFLKLPGDRQFPPTIVPGIAGPAFVDGFVYSTLAV